MRPNDYMISVYRGETRSPVTAEDVETAVLGLWEAEVKSGLDTVWDPEGIYFSILAAIERDSEGKRRPKSGYGRPEDIVVREGWPRDSIYLNDYETDEHFPLWPDGAGYDTQAVADAINEMVRKFVKNESHPNIWGMPQRFAIIAERDGRNPGVGWADPVVGMWPAHTAERDSYGAGFIGAKYHNLLGFQ